MSVPADPWSRAQRTTAVPVTRSKISRPAPARITRSSRPVKSRRPLVIRVIGCLMVAGSSVPTPVEAMHYEHQLIAIADNIRHGYVDSALTGARALVERHPESRLARMMYADLLSARLSRLPDVGAGTTLSDTVEVVDLREELIARWNRLKSDPVTSGEKLPNSLLQPATSTEHVVFADLSQSRLYLYENDQGNLRLVNDFYVTQGLNGPGKEREGDQRTPVGVYYVTGYIPGNTLPSRYGPGALPISYPNPIDQRYQRTGYGIWIHGTEPFLLNRAPRASDGCLSLNNNDFNRLTQAIGHPRHTPVVIDDSPTWVSAREIEVNRKELLTAIENWRADWESLDANAYLSHYDSEHFSDGSQNYNAWAARKRSILAFKRRIDVALRDIEMFAYPGEQDTVLVDFEQTFISPTFSSTIRKQQFWRRGDSGTWRIIFEGASEKSPPPAVVNESVEPIEQTDPASS
ncbi:MAG: hypothetical protein DWQ08_01780 [Proteobacteria bacterium]|nr:MAG: hypothetical protein DWQ08_01780 [Pseudomonadota bacterium]